MDKKEVDDSLDKIRQSQVSKETFLLCLQLDSIFLFVEKKCTLLLFPTFVLYFCTGRCAHFLLKNKV